MESELYNFDKDLMREFNWFLYKINERACIKYGYIDKTYEPVNRYGVEEPGLGYDVEYFHPSITLDDRMRYIAVNIAPRNSSYLNVLGNTIITHFYGAQGVVKTISGERDPKKALVDFDRIRRNDQDYIHFLRENADYQTKVLNRPIWETTALHTSIQGAAKKFCQEKYDDPQRKFHAIDVCEWVASFSDNGILDGLLRSEHIREAYNTVVALKGIGDYYGFHCGASTSILPFMKYHNDQRFVRPGPGCRYTISLLWPDLSKKYYPEAIYFLRERSDEIGLTEGVEFHPETYNINGILSQPQDSLKYYGTEVLTCQFGIYLQIKNDQKACDRRRIFKDKGNSSLEGFFE